MTRLSTSALCALAALLLGACGSEAGPANLCPGFSTDNVLPAPDPRAPPPAVWRVTYSATRTSGSRVLAVRYRDAAGARITVQSPEMPWSVVIPGMLPGDPVEIQADAEAPSGQVVLNITAVTGDPQVFAEEISQGIACP